MARIAMTAVENLGPFDAPTPTVGDNLYNGGDGVFFTEDPGRPATLALYNLSANGAATVTVAVNPGAPGTPAAHVFTFGGANTLFVVPPGYLPPRIFRRNDDEATNPGTIYLTASDDLVMGCIVRGPAGVAGKLGAGAGPAITGARTLVTPQTLAPLGSISVGAVMTDTDGLAYYPKGNEALVTVRASGVQTTTLTVNPNNVWGSTTDVTATQALANELVLFPPGSPPLDLIRRSHATNPGVVYFSSNQAGSTRYALAGMAGRHL